MNGVPKGLQLDADRFESASRMMRIRMRESAEVLLGLAVVGFLSAVLSTEGPYIRGLTSGLTLAFVIYTLVEWIEARRHRKEAERIAELFERNGYWIHFDNGEVRVAPLHNTNHR
ncbi:hypothetical protein FHY55_02550 [Oceanicola sp. D3]|nr:hypothetical protein FHY55_02550 [Oceanicola sp. D3]